MIISIPLDTSTQILNYLNNKDLINFSITSKQGMNLCNQYRATSAFYIRSLNEAYNHFESVETMIEFVRQNLFSHIGIENLNLSGFKNEINDDLFIAITQCVHLVGTLTIHNVTVTAIQTIGHRLTSLQKLVWKLPETEPRSNFRRALNFAKGANHLINLNELKVLEGSSEILLTSQFQQLPNLKKLTTKGDNSPYILCNFTSVEQIHIKNNSRLRDHMVSSLLKKPNLKNLAIENCLHITNACQEMSEQYPHIQLNLL